jgi:hypothetical protein
MTIETLTTFEKTGKDGETEEIRTNLRRKDYSLHILFVFLRRESMIRKTIAD